MDPHHLQAHLRELAGRRQFLRPLKPDSERYKLWLGDVVETVNVGFGPDSAEFAELRGLLAGRPRLPASAPDAEREHDYLERIEALGDLLERFAARLGDATPAPRPNGDHR